MLTDFETIRDAAVAKRATRVRLTDRSEDRAKRYTRRRAQTSNEEPDFDTLPNYVWGSAEDMYREFIEGR